jgi:hypothetical protein
VPSTVPRGHYAIEPEPGGFPYVLQEDQEDPQRSQPRGPLFCREEGFVISAGSRGTVVLHPDDAAGLRPLPGGENSTGCCGPTGDEGPNLACGCGAPVATLAADCFGPYELHLDPARTRPSTGWHGGRPASRRPLCGGDTPERGGLRDAGGER